MLLRTRSRAAVGRARDPDRHGRCEAREKQAVVPCHRLGLRAWLEPHDVAADRVDGESAERGHRRESCAIGVALEPRLDCHLHIGEIAGERRLVERLERDRLQREVTRSVVHLQVRPAEHVGHKEGMRVLPADVLRVVERRRPLDPRQEHHTPPGYVRFVDVAMAIAADLEEPVRVANESRRLTNQRKPHGSGWEARAFGPQACGRHRASQGTPIGAGDAEAGARGPGPA